MGKCCVLGCTSSDNVECFKFPASKALRASWLAACGAAGAVCAAHFAEDDITRTRTGRRLRGGAVPRAHAQNVPSKAEIAETSEDTNNQTDTHEKDSVEKTDDIAPETATDKAETIDKDSEKEEITTDKAETTIDKDIEKEISKKVRIDSRDGETRTEICVKENGSMKIDTPQPEEKDIEDMITNYQIKQTKTLADRLNPEPLEDLIPSIMSNPARLDQLARSLPNITANSLANGFPKDAKWDSQFASQLASQLASKLDSQLDGMLSGAAPVFIEVPAMDAATSRAASPEDCVMLLENVQCDVDPSSLMLPDHDPDTDSDMEIISCDKKEDPISLLTSSDEDEVILQEPHIDTVEVSDETDEDDRPLTALIKTKKETLKIEKKTEVWGMYEFYCVQCEYRTENESEFKRHMLEPDHSTAIQICPICNYTTASKAQYSRHKRKHRDERNFKCHLCNYKARHNMSLMYHLKSHNATSERRPKFTCDKCGFSSHLKSEGLKHIKVCDAGRLFCDSCTYSTKRRSDLRRHRIRRHSVDDDDEDFRA